MSIDKFYFDILNIAKKQSEEESLQKQIEMIINSEIKKMQPYINSFDGMCKVICFNILDKLRQLEIPANLFNTRDLLGINEHVAIIISYTFEQKVNYILVDPTYDQFVKKSNFILRPFYDRWPSEILKEKDSELFDNLIHNNYARVTNDSFNNYLYSLMGKKAPLFKKIELVQIMTSSKKCLK
ncbi:MAG: hypothetical protein RR847_03340 [Bacilli bacterium]